MTSKGNAADNCCVIGATVVPGTVVLVLLASTVPVPGMYRTRYVPYLVCTVPGTWYLVQVHVVVLVVGCGDYWAIQLTNTTT